MTKKILELAEESYEISRDKEVFIRRCDKIHESLIGSYDPY